MSVPRAEEHGILKEDHSGTPRAGLARDPARLTDAWSSLAGRFPSYGRSRVAI